MLSGAQPWHHKTEHNDHNQISEAGTFMLQGIIEIAGQRYGNGMIGKVAAQQPWRYSSISWLRTPCPAGFLDPLVS
jgi:hypothetical protein